MTHFAPYIKFYSFPLDLTRTSPFISIPSGLGQVGG